MHSPGAAVVVRSMASSWRVVVPVLAAAAISLACLPNGVVTGSRPAPYGIFVPTESCYELQKHHAFAVWLERPTSPEEFCAKHWVPRERLPALIEFNREFGLELASAPGADFPAGVPIWFPPEERSEATCFVWIWSSRDGWVSHQSDGDGLRGVRPTYAHAALDSGSISVLLFPVPLRHQREWAELARHAPPNLGDPKVLPAVTKELRALVDFWRTPSLAPQHHFHFIQWVDERSKVARMLVSLPIAEVGGKVQFEKPPTVHWIDASGNATSPHGPPSSPTSLWLVATTGGGLLFFAWFAVARRRQSAAP